MFQKKLQKRLQKKLQNKSSQPRLTHVKWHFVRTYKRAEVHITMLEASGVTLMYNVDATDLSQTPGLKDKVFDRILFNAPHCGVFGKEWSPSSIREEEYEEGQSEGGKEGQSEGDEDGQTEGHEDGQSEGGKEGQLLI
ncbi:hypothetical protein HanRHA438_Chr07g0288611 [Helianthus annuus]|nr:hypothetical protein HanRHA438_Chr07g0288611 [Helianthus annuus]